MFELRDGPALIGQFSADEIKRMGEFGRLNPNMEIRRLPSGSWNSIFKVSGLKIAVPPQPQTIAASCTAGAVASQSGDGEAKPKANRLVILCAALACLCLLLYIVMQGGSPTFTPETGGATGGPLGFTCFFLGLYLTAPGIFFVLRGFRELGQRARMAKSLATIHCHRCGHEGRAKIVFLPGRGLTGICSKCRGDDWTKGEGSP